MLDIQEIESKLTDLKYSVKNGEISSNAKGHDDLEHPFLQMMQQFVKDGKQTEFEKMFKEASEKMLNSEGSESTGSIRDNLTTKTKPKDLEVGDEFFGSIITTVKDENGKNKRTKPIDFWKVIEKDTRFGIKYTVMNNKGEKLKTSASGITMRKASDFQDKLHKELEKLKQKLEEEKKRLAEEAKYVDISKMEPEEQLKKIIEAGMRNIWMVGPAGCGKSTMARNVANELNVPYLCISCGIGTSATEFVGYKYPTRESTKFAEYYAKPSVILIDEMTALDPAVGQVLNAALANGEIETTTGLVCRHPECIIIATSNTFGNGASRQYVANNQLDASTIDRFTGGIIEVNYSVDYESQYDTDVVNYVWKLRDIIKECNLRRVASTRMIQSGHLMKKAYFKNWKEMLITNWTDSEKEIVSKELDFSTRFLQVSEIKSEIKKAA